MTSDRLFSEAGFAVPKRLWLIENRTLSRLSAQQKALHASHEGLTAIDSLRTRWYLAEYRRPSSDQNRPSRS